MEMKINQYQFDRICSQMEKEFGKVKKGQEEEHMMVLFPMESNLLKIRRANPASNSRRLLEAIPIALFHVKGYLSDDRYDLGQFESGDNEQLVQAMLMAFDPFTNEEIRESLEETSIDLGNAEDLRAYFKEPVSCLLRIKDSVETWGKRMGADGYFDFLESYMGALVPQDGEMGFSVVLPEQDMED